MSIPVGPAAAPGCTGRLLSECLGVLAAPPECVNALLVDFQPGPVDAELPPVVLGDRARDAVVEGGPQRFVVRLGGTVPLTVELDQAGVTMRGQWWWCGAYRVSEHHEGSLLRYRVYNVVTGPRGWLVEQTLGRGHRARARRAFEATLRGLGRRLECPTRWF